MKREKIAQAQKRHQRLSSILSKIYEAGSEMCSMGESTKRIDHQWKFFAKREKRLFKKYGELLFNADRGRR